MSFNGWTNKETWLVNLWLGDTLAMDQEEGINVTADYIESLVDELVEQESIQNGFIRDLLTHSYCGVNYQELASHYEESD